MPSTGGWTRYRGRPEPEGSRTAGKPSLWVSLLIPDLGLFVSIVTLFYCLFLFDGCRNLFRDSDTGWHIRTGETIVDTGTLPRTDPYSFTRHGEPWFAWEWGADVLMGAVHKKAGLPGVAALYALTIAACTWLWFRLHWAVGGDFLLACLMVSPMLSTANMHWLARPHVFSWIFLLAALLAAERVRGGFRPWHALAIAAFSALWANLHASFFFAPLIAGLYAAGCAVRPLLWELDAAAEFQRARWFALAALSALAGSFLNPYGWQLHAHLAHYLTNHELLARVGEFLSFNFHLEGAWQIALMFGLAGLGTSLAFGQRRVSHFLLGAVLLAVALRSARGLPVAALLLLPLANGAIAETLRNAQGLRSPLARWRDIYFAYSGRLRGIDAGCRGFVLVPLIALLAIVALHAPAVAARTGFPPDQFPVAAAEEVGKLPATARLLAPDKYGGYLIYRFAGRRQVFMDGRSDFYGVDFMKSYIELVEVRPGWRGAVERFGFTHALLPVNYSLVSALEAEGWTRLYADGTAVLLARKADPEVRLSTGRPGGRPRVRAPALRIGLSTGRPGGRTPWSATNPLVGFRN